MNVTGKTSASSPLKNRRGSENEGFRASSRRRTGGKSVDFVEDSATPSWRERSVCSPCPVFQRAAKIGRLCLVLVFLFGSSTPAVLAETLQLPGQGTTSSGDFFRDKFACVRWVKEKAPDSKCLECHATIVKAEVLSLPEQEGSPSRVMMIHVQHMRSGKVNFTCITCHKTIDPYQTSSAGLRRQVPANMCFKCHFPHGQE